MKTKGLHLARN